MRLVFIFLLMALAAPAWAEWVKYGETDIASLYYEPATIKKHGNRVGVWRITDLKERHKDGALSFHGLEEYDCKEERVRFVSLTAFSGPMASGKILRSARKQFERNILPGSVAETMLKILCR